MNRTGIIALAITILLLVGCGARGVVKDSGIKFSDLSCDFDSNTFCGYKNNPNDDFDWLLNSGPSYNRGTGPNADHTTGNPSGFYIYTKAAVQYSGDQARLDAVKATAPPTGACVRFWYHMHGSRMGTLTVYTGDEKGGLGPSRWSKKGDSGDYWQEASINIYPGSEFQITFVGECRESYTNDIAIDDIVVLERQCSSYATFSDLKCDFDSESFCAYNNSQNDDFDWLLNSGSTFTGVSGPDVDHSKGDSSGFYIYIKAMLQNPGDQARLDAVKATAPATGACIKFWYHMHGAGMGTLMVYTGDGKGGLGPSRWSKSGDSGDVWQEASINVRYGVDFQISFVGECGRNPGSEIAVDDIIVLEGQCGSYATFSDLECDFDFNGFCTYKNNLNNDFDWHLHSGPISSPGNGPQADRTTGDSSGFYIYSEPLGHIPGKQARLDGVKATAPATGACVRFWYYMYWGDEGTLTVYTGDGKGGLGPSRWSRKGNSGDYWQEAWININPGSEFQITFVGETVSGFSCDLAIDDIVVLERQCDSTVLLSDLNCDFDSRTFCAYKNSQNDDFDWILNSGSTPGYMKGTGPTADHTTGYSRGFYIYSDTSKPQRQGDKARIDSAKAIAPATGACVRFWYHMYGKGIGSLRVYTGDDKGGLGPLRWSKNGNYGYMWRETSIDIDPNKEFWITFVAECGWSFLIDIAIDDISVQEGPCDTTRFLLNVAHLNDKRIMK